MPAKINVHSQFSFHI